MRLKLEDSWPSPIYRRGDDGAWPRGEARDVSAEFGQYLLDTFPTHFSIVKKKKKKKKTE